MILVSSLRYRFFKRKSKKQNIDSKSSMIPKCSDGLEIFRWRRPGAKKKQRPYAFGRIGRSKRLILLQMMINADGSPERDDPTDDGKEERELPRRNHEHRSRSSPNLHFVLYLTEKYFYFYIILLEKFIYINNKIIKLALNKPKYFLVLEFILFYFCTHLKISLSRSWNIKLNFI